MGAGAIDCMARTRNRGIEKPPTGGRNVEIDDIDLLNIYRYPENYPRELVAGVQSSKDLQKRLESLLRAAAGPVPRTNQKQAAQPPSHGTVSQIPPRAEGQKSAAAHGKPKSGVGQIAKLIKKLIP